MESDNNDPKGCHNGHDHEHCLDMLLLYLKTTCCN